MAALATVVPVGLGTATPTGAMAAQTAPALDGEGACTFPAPDVAQTPWFLQRVLLSRLWQSTQGKGVTVAVIDSGIDTRNPQLANAVDASRSADLTGAGGRGTTDPVGHGTEVAGIIAARPSTVTGFVGLAPQATLISVRQAGRDGTGTVEGLARALRQAVAEGADVINVSQDTPRGTPGLEAAVAAAVRADAVIVASAGNGGSDGAFRTTYPGGYPGVLAVGASDRNDERAPFSQAGEFVAVAAPGVDMLSTVPGGGQCIDNGTSFAAPYAAGVAALIRAEHPTWTAAEVIAQIEQTARRTSPGHNALVGWGVVDPVRALTDDAERIETPTPDPDPGERHGRAHAIPAALTPPDPARQREERTATYLVTGSAAAVLLLTGTTITLRDRRRRA
ncbi:type VII secretion-associated serine protease mycosin [Streptomyces sp. NPDC020983]|uniref:type VII secretion-associated serine protease mycosin n=1 Tax=Streptomyces sp. NPDC020983 TaxID=3365106 RepID=UPI0037961F6D